MIKIQRKEKKTFVQYVTTCKFIPLSCLLRKLQEAYGHTPPEGGVSADLSFDQWLEKLPRFEVRIVTNPLVAYSQRQAWVMTGKQGCCFNFPTGLSFFLLLHGYLSSSAQRHSGTGPARPGRWQWDRQRAAVQWHTLPGNSCWRASSRSEQMSCLCCSKGDRAGCPQGPAVKTVHYSSHNTVKAEVVSQWFLMFYAGDF